MSATKTKSAPAKQPFRLTGQHVVVLNDARHGVDFTFDPTVDKLAASVTPEERIARIGYYDHELIAQVAEHRPDLVRTGQPMGKNPHAVLGAMLTGAGRQFVDEYLAGVSWKLEPQNDDLDLLVNNYNEYVMAETVYDPISHDMFLDIIGRDELFRQHWAPLL